MNKKAFTLTEILICITIISILIVTLVRALKPNMYSEKTNVASARKTLETVDQGLLQLVSMEKTYCPTGKFLYDPGTGTDEFAIYNAANSAKIDSSGLMTLLANHLKLEGGVISSCSQTGNCTDTNIKGGKLAGGAYIAIEVFSSLANCPAYRVPGDTTDSPAPTKFNPKTGGSSTAKCWGKLYIDIDGTGKGLDENGKDRYVYGLGEHGIAR